MHVISTLALSERDNTLSFPSLAVGERATDSPVSPERRALPSISSSASVLDRDLAPDGLGACTALRSRSGLAGPLSEKDVVSLDGLYKK